MPRRLGRSIGPALASAPSSPSEGEVYYDTATDQWRVYNGADWIDSFLKGYVNHGSTAGTARPVGYVSVEWTGSVEPTNAVNGDTWVDTS